ncbi:MAG TPA: glycosyltransferase family 39 protein [Xanthobacteraceae bacterium]|nr:glycosyltransferase family 39 protein [Xanthobacteraceae bacterium]
MAALAAWIERRPGGAFAAFALLHSAVWTALPSLLYANLPLDLIEALTYGREWQLGYDKLPPLPWWLVEIVYRLFGADTAYYAASEVVIIATFALVFATARPLVGAAGALVAVLIIDGLHYFNYTAPKFNHDVIQLPLWALAGLAFRSGLRYGRIADWLLLGLALGLALWAKYFVVMLAAPLGIFLVVDRKARRALATPGPWVALAAALVVMAPHLVWLAKNDFLPFAYASARAAPSRGVIDHLVHPLVFALSQLATLVPALAIAAPLAWPRPQERTAGADDFDRRIVTVLAFGPAATTIAASLVTGRGLVAMWGYPLWLFLGLWIVMTARTAIDRVRLARIVTLWAIVFAGFALAFIVNYTVLPHIDHRYRAAFFPGDRLGAEIAQRYRAATGQPLRYVIATMWAGGNVSRYAAERPRVLIDGNPRRAPWIDLADLRAYGAAVVWVVGDPNVMPAQLREAAGAAQLQPPFKLAAHNGEDEVTVGWAILPPRK